MARLHEYEGKALLKKFGVPVPKGGPAFTVGEARALAVGIGAPVVLKAQAWITGRAGRGAIRFADDSEGAETAAKAMLGMKIGNFTVDQLIVEDKLQIAQEVYLGMIIDERARAPVRISSSVSRT